MAQYLQVSRSTPCPVPPGCYTACQQFDWDFEECCAWQRFFVVLTPVSSNDTYTRHILSAWKACGVDVSMEVLNITTRTAGFEVYLHCFSCSQWNHYLICKHSYSQAKEDHLVVCLPQTLEDRTALRQRDLCGNGKKAKRRLRVGSRFQPPCSSRRQALVIAESFAPLTRAADICGLHLALHA
eukprot:3827276-Rhodomonas_salina.1